MKRIVAAFLLLVALCSQAAAQELQARYHVVDMADSGKNRIEIWKISPVEKENETFYKITKETFAKNPLQETEFHKRWTREAYGIDQDVYTREFLTENPVDMDPGDKSFGYAELREAKSDQVLDSWPLFYEVVEIAGGRRATFHILFRGGFLMKIIRDYEDNETYFFPVQESRIVTQDGEIVRHIVFTRQDQE